MKIGNFEIGINHPPFVIAEMSANHNGSLERALKLVEVAAGAGAQALKLQTYTADTMTLDIREGEFFISDPASLWHGHSLYELYEKAQTPWEWHETIFERAKELGMVAFSSPFDESAVDFLEKLDVPCYKIASFENVDLPLIRYVAATGKPLIISTGLASVAEIEEAVHAARAGGCNELVVLKCTSSYPATPENSNVRTIPHMRELLKCEIGLSDHTAGHGASMAAVALGATVIEKHFTLSRSDGGVDSDFSLEPNELASLVVEAKRAWQSLGMIHYGITDAESGSLIYRRSLYIVKDMDAGEELTSSNLGRIRPGHGLSPKYYEQFIGRQVNRPVKRGTPVTWDLIIN